MRQSMTHRPLLLAGLSIGVATLVTHALAGNASTQPATDYDKLNYALKADVMQLASLPEAMPSDPATRQREVERVIAIAHDAMAVIDKLPPDCRGQDMTSMKVSWEPLLIAFGDQNAIAAANRDALGTGPAAVLARVSIALADRMNAGDDAKTADAAVARIIREAQQNPTDDSAALALFLLSEDDGLSATMHAAAAAALSKSSSRTGSMMRFAKSRPATQPAQ